jgi:hypothetical protein
LLDRVEHECRNRFAGESELGSNGFRGPRVETTAS